MIGGFAGREMSDIYVYEIPTKIWRRIQTQLPEPRSVFASVSVGHEGHVIFGGELSPSLKGHEGAGNFSSEVIYLKEAGNDVTIQKAEVVSAAKPEARGWTSAFQIGINRFAVFGGLTGNDESPVRLDDLWIGKLTC